MARLGKELIKEELQYIERDIEDVTGNITGLQTQLVEKQKTLATLKEEKIKLEADEAKLEAKP